MSIQDPKNLLSITSRNEFREWLTENYAQAQECWVMVKRGIPQTDTNFWYIDAVEEAMCFGWIDSTYKVIIPGKPALQRFVPRKQRSIWSELNKARCTRMEAKGQMTTAGKAKLPDMNPNNFKIDKRIK